MATKPKQQLDMLNDSAIPVGLNDVLNAMKILGKENQFSTNEDYISFIEELLRARLWQKNSPGWKALFNPVTKIDKAFQIYYLNYLLHSGFKKRDAVDYNDRKKYENIALKAAGDYLLKELKELSDLKADKTHKHKEALKHLERMLYKQFDNELPYNAVMAKDKDGIKESEHMQYISNILYKRGTLEKIKAQDGALDDINFVEKKVNIADYGSIKDMIDAVILQKHQTIQLGFDL